MIERERGCVGGCRERGSIIGVTTFTTSSDGFWSNRKGSKYMQLNNFGRFLLWQFAIWSRRMRVVVKGVTLLQRHGAAAKSSVHQHAKRRGERKSGFLQSGTFLLKTKVVKYNEKKIQNDAASVPHRRSVLAKPAFKKVQYTEFWHAQKNW